MTILVVTAQNTRINDMNSLTVGQSISNIGTGAGSGLENTWFWQSGAFVARKITATGDLRGYFTDITTSVDLSTATGTHQTVIFKFAVSTSPDLQNFSNPGLILRIGSDDSNYEEYDIQGADTWPPKDLWLIEAIDPNIAGYVDDSTNGTPVLTVVDYYGIAVQFVVGGAKELNVGLDAIDVGSGLTVVSGTSSDPAATFEDFAVFDIDTNTNRFGYAVRNDSGIAVLGQLILGNATETRFTSVSEVVSFSDGRFAAGFSGLVIGLDNASSLIDLTNCVFLGKGNTTTTDTRPTVTVTGSSGAGTATGCVFDAFASIILTSECTWLNCTISNSGLIEAGSGADLAGSSVLTSTVAANASAMEWDVNLDPDGELDDMLFTIGTNAHHAIEFGLISPLTMTVRGMTVTGFNAADANNDSTFHVKRTTGTVTINVIGGTGNFSFRTDGATVNIVIDPVTTLVNVKDNVGVNLSGGRVLLEASDGTGDFPFEESVTITRSGSTASVAHTAHGLVNNDIAVIRGADQQEYNGPFTITNVTTNAYDYTVSGTPDTPATGAIISSGAILNGTTDGSGNISASRTFTGTQPVKGSVRKSTSSPRFKSFGLADSISNTVGLTINVRMIIDE